VAIGRREGLRLFLDSDATTGALFSNLILVWPRLREREAALSWQPIHSEQSNLSYLEGPLELTATHPAPVRSPDRERESIPSESYLSYLEEARELSEEKLSEILAKNGMGLATLAQVSWMPAGNSSRLGV
jgi:hypothetical protein